MLSLMTLGMISLAIVYVFGALKLIAAAANAPVGYEDEAGFHFGLEMKPVRGSDETRS